MSLLNLKTDLKSLKFGKDRPGGGSSGQPYIQKPIPEGGDPSNIFNTGGPDTVLRGGLIAPIRATEDVSRLAQMLVDAKSPNGPLFTPKQNLLIRTGVKVEAGGGTNASRGFYLPLNTLRQTGGGFLGFHDDFLLGKGTYESIAKRNNEAANNTFPQKSITIIPGGIIPETNLLDLAGLPTILGSEGGFSRDITIPEINIPTITNVTRTGGFSNRLLKIWHKTQLSKNNSNIILSYSGGPGSNLGVGRTTINFASQRTGVNNPKYEEGIRSNTNPRGFSVLSEEQISDKDKNLDNSIQDFRIELPEIKNEIPNRIVSLAPDYKTKNIEARLHLGDPGKSFGKNVLKYSGTSTEALDKINALEMYSSTGSIVDKPTNDLVKFRIAAIDNNETNGTAIYMHFRAFIDSFSDSYTGNWSDVNYVGRGNKFYTYGGFDRKISMGFTVYAQSKAELIPMYKKLNYLASTLAPDYSSGGFMRGNLVRLTVGGYLYEQPGFITSLTYDIPQESTWEIGINETGGYDSSVKELPHMIKITGLSFTPIHTFLPQKVKTIAPYSGERYIALNNGVNNNYD